MAEKESTSQAEVTEVHNEEKAPTEEQQKPSDGVEEAKVPETTEEPEAPKTYSKEEWDTRESAFQSDRDTKIAEANKAHKEALTEKNEQIRQAQEATADKKLDDWVKSVEEQGGDVAVAKQVAERDKAVRKDRAELDERKRKQDETDASQQSTLKYLDAQKLAKEHDIPVEPLLEADSPQRMREIAQTEKNKKLEARITELEGEGKERPVTTTDKGIGTGMGEDLSKLSPRQLAVKAYEEGGKKK